MAELAGLARGAAFVFVAPEDLRSLLLGSQQVERVIGRDRRSLGRRRDRVGDLLAGAELDRLHRAALRFDVSGDPTGRHEPDPSAPVGSDADDATAERRAVRIDRGGGRNRGVDRKAPAACRVVVSDPQQVSFGVEQHDAVFLVHERVDTGEQVAGRQAEAGQRATGARIEQVEHRIAPDDRRAERHRHPVGTLQDGRAGSRELVRHDDLRSGPGPG